jgi:dTDP-4-amino-4,6-dideoxygalactose transaminase
LQQGEDFPVSNRLAKTVMSLPMHPYLSAAEIGLITQSIKEYLHA